MIIKKITSKQDGLKLEIAIMECENPKGIVQFSHGWQSIRSAILILCSI